MHNDMKMHKDIGLVNEYRRYHELPSLEGLIAFRMSKI